MARFWKAPLVGAYLSHLTVPEPATPSYASNFGQTSALGEPHEFSWFWQDLLELHTHPQDEEAVQKRKLDRSRIRRKVLGFNEVLRAPLVFKPLELVGFNIEQFAGFFDRSVFVFIDRSAMDMAFSIYKAKKKNEVLPNDWWGSRPPEDFVRGLEGTSLENRVAGQMHYFRELYKNKLPQLPQDKLVMTSYEELCEAPTSVLERIAAKSGSGHGAVKVTNNPAPFARGAAIDVKDHPALFAALQDWGVSDRFGISEV